MTVSVLCLCLVMPWVVLWETDDCGISMPYSLALRKITNCQDYALTFAHLE